MSRIDTHQSSKTTYAESAAPATPAAGLVYVYAKTDGRLYSKDDAGVERLVSGGSGTAFPTAVTGDRFWRTDHAMEFAYDGTRWRSTQTFIAPLATEVLLPMTATDQLWRAYIRGPLDLDVWLLSCKTQTYVITTNNGSNYWTVVVKKGSDNTSLGSFTTSADTADTTTDHNITFGAASTEKRVYMDATKTAGTPGNLFVWAALYYQLIAT